MPACRKEAVHPVAAAPWEEGRARRSLRFLASVVAPPITRTVNGAARAVCRLAMTRPTACVSALRGNTRPVTLLWALPESRALPGQVGWLRLCGRAVRYVLESIIGPVSMRQRRLAGAARGGDGVKATGRGRGERTSRLRRPARRPSGRWRAGAADLGRRAAAGCTGPRPSARSARPLPPPDPRESLAAGSRALPARSS
jgi:hypothetical protein